MHCLHCGICCKQISPKSAPFTCPDLVRTGDYYFCKCYAHSPRLCQEFDVIDIEYCPYGLNHLQLSYPEDEAILQERVETGRRLIEELNRRAQQKHEA